MSFRPFRCISFLTIAGMLVAGVHAAEPAKLQALINSARGGAASSKPAVSKKFDGSIRSLSAPSGGYFPVANPGKGDPASLAINFLNEQKATLGILESAQFKALKVKDAKIRSYVRLQQIEQGLPVFGAQTIVQTIPGKGVEAVISHLAGNEEIQSMGSVAAPQIDQAKAASIALEYMKTLQPKKQYQVLASELVFFAPKVIGARGDAQPAWTVDCTTLGNEPMAYRIFVSAEEGNVVFHYSLTHDATTRIILSSGGTGQVTLTPHADVTIYSGDQFFHGSEPQLKIGESGSITAEKTLVNWNIDASVPQNSIINTASFVLRALPVAMNSGPQLVQVSKVTSSWTEAANSSTSVTSTSLGPGINVATGGSITSASLNFLPYVQDVVNGTADNGLLFAPVNPHPDPDNIMYFYSREGATPPSLSISFDRPATLLLRENDRNRQPRNESGAFNTSVMSDAIFAWDYLTDAEQFYAQIHSRNGVDNAFLPLTAVVGSAIENAMYNSTNRNFVIGAGFAADDILAHEYTHGVTDFESGLIYFGESGAINESLSDAWGEWIDQWNTALDQEGQRSTPGAFHGNDDADVKWLVGEDLPQEYLDNVMMRGPLDLSEPEYSGALGIRNMKQPNAFLFETEDYLLHEFPDRYFHPDFFRGEEDNGGVHINCTVGDKLVYLLTDGDTFNGYTISGFGLQKTARLFYEVQTNLLPSSASYADLRSALLQAAQNLGFSASDILNIDNATRAVEIIGFSNGLVDTDGFIDASSADASFVGEDGGDISGWSVANVGSVNGDAFEDFLIGAPQDGTLRTKAGRAYLFLGKAAGWVPKFDTAQADAIFIGEQAGDQAGLSVAGAGDVNGDGLADMLIGAPLNGGPDWRGKAYLVLGRSTANWGRSFNLSNADASWRAETLHDYAGRAVAGAGDINGDGFDDILIGSPYWGPQDQGGSFTYKGKTYIIFGKSAADWGRNIRLSNSDAAFEGEKSFDYSGWSVAGAGNVNGDTFDDIVIGAPFNSDASYAPGDGSIAIAFNAGQTYVIYGKPTAQWADNATLASANASFQGERPGDHSGFAVAPAGDVDGDGLDDILIGAPDADVNAAADAGKAYLVHGSPALSMDTPLEDAFGASFVIERTNYRLGFSVAGDDINGDGLSDMLFGAPRSNPEVAGVETGAVFLLFGGLGPDLTPSGYGENFDLIDSPVIFVGEDNLDRLGTSIATGRFSQAGSGADILIGAYNDRTGGDTGATSFIGAGETFLFLNPFSTAVATVARQQPPGNPTSEDMKNVRISVDHATGNASQDTITLRRFKTGLGLKPLNKVANAAWQLKTNRANFTCDVTLQYTDAEVQGLNEGGLAIYQAASPAGPWKELTTTVNTRANSAKATGIATNGYFAIGEKGLIPVPTSAKKWEMYR